MNVVRIGRCTFNLDRLDYSNDYPELDTVVVYLNTQKRHKKRSLTFFGEDRTKYLEIVSGMARKEQKVEVKLSNNPIFL